MHRIERSLISGFIAHTKRAPDRLAVEDGELKWSYKQLSDKSTSVAEFLLNRPARHKRALLLVGKTNYSVSAVLGTFMAGWSHLCLDEDTPPALLEDICKRFKPDVALVANEGGEFTSEVLNTAQSATPTYAVKNLIDGAEADSMSYEEIENTCSSDEDIAFYMLTSGSTGKPKIILLSHRAFANAIKMRTTDFPYDEEDKLGVLSRFAFIAPWDILTAFHVGGTAVLIPTQQFRDGNALSNTLDRHTISRITLIPSALQIALENFSGKNFAPKLKSVVLTGDIIPEQLIKTLKNSSIAHISFYSEYALTEAYYLLGAQIDLIHPACANCFPIPNEESFARLLPYEEAENNDHRVMIAARGPVLFSGYLGENDEVTLPLNEDGLFETGDVFTKSDTSVCYKSRAGRRINWCGWRIEPEEIELAVCKCEHISAARLYVDTSRDDPGELTCAVASSQPLAKLETIVSDIIKKTASSSFSEHIRLEKKEYDQIKKIR